MKNNAQILSDDNNDSKPQATPDLQEVEKAFDDAIVRHIESAPSSTPELEDWAQHRRRVLKSQRVSLADFVRDGSPADVIIESFAGRVEGLAKRTVEDYTACLTKFARFLAQDNTSLLKVTRADVQDFMRTLRTGETKVSPSRQKSHLAAIRKFYTYLASEDDTWNHDPTIGIDRPAVKITPGATLSREELNAILYANGTAKDRIQAWLLAYTAARSSEIRQLKWSDLDFENRWMTLHGKGDKPRMIYIHDHLMRELARWHQAQQKQAESNKALAIALSNPDTAFVVLTKNGNPLPPKALWKALKCRAARAGVRLLNAPKDNRGRVSENKSAVTPHMLRRTFATLILRDGESLDVIADLLGHASLDTTRRHYAFNSLQQHADAVKRFNID